MVTLTISTEKSEHWVDITRKLEDLLRQNQWSDGILTVFVPHTTAAVTINENADPDVVSDMKMIMQNLVPQVANYRHMEGNSAAHMKASLFGTSETLIVKDSKIQLGTWQSVYFCEFDGPRERNLKVHFTVDLS